MQRTALKNTGKTVVAAALASKVLPDAEKESEAPQTAKPEKLQEDKIRDEWQVVSSGRPPVTIEFLTKEETDEAAETAVQLMLGVRNGEEIEVYTESNRKSKSSSSSDDQNQNELIEEAELEMMMCQGEGHHDIVPHDYDAFKAMTREVASDPKVQAAVWSNPAFKNLFGEHVVNGEKDQETRSARLQGLGTPFLHPNLLSPPVRGKSNSDEDEEEGDEGSGNEIDLKAFLKDMERSFVKASEVLAKLSHQLGNACKDFFSSLFGESQEKGKVGVQVGKEGEGDVEGKTAAATDTSIDMSSILTPVISVVSAVMAIALLRRSGIFLRLRTKPGGVPSVL